MFLASDAPGIVFEGPCLLRVKMSDDKHALSKGRRLLSSVATRAGQPVTSAPSLDALAALLHRCKRKARAAKADAATAAMWTERGARVCLIIASQLIEMKVRVFC